MDNNDVTLKKTKYKKKKIFSIVCVFLLFGIIIYGYRYHSTDLKNDQKVNDYLVRYMNKKYNIKATLALKKKELIDICTFRMVDGSCFNYANNNNIYEYEFNGVDNDNNKFSINYTNSYIGRYKMHDSKIIENYKIFDDSKKLEGVISKYSKKFDIYKNMYDENNVIVDGNKKYDDNHLIVRMYIDIIDLNNILELNKEIEKFNTVSNIIITTDRDVYDKALSSNEITCFGCEIFKEVGFSHPNILSEQLGYSYVKKNRNVSHYFFDEINYINIDNKSSYYTLIIFGSGINVYQKQK